VSDGEVVAFAPPHRARRWLLAFAILVVAAVVAILVARPFTATISARQTVDNAQAISLATVTRQSLASQMQETGTLGYAGSVTIVNQTQGVLTAIPAIGSVITQGEVLYRVNGRPIVLLYGSTPAYRSLAEGAGASDVTSPDVTQLNADLVALGYATPDEIPAGSKEFSWQTKAALEKVQAHLGYATADQTGALALGQAVFLPGPARITTVASSLGAPAQPGQVVLTATSTNRVVTLNVDPAEQSQIKAGDTVSITLPDNSTTPGVVSSLGRVAVAPAAVQGSQNSSPTITVEITPSDSKATGSFDQAPVTVAITTARAANALVVPVTALLALAGGGYAVEVVDAGQTHFLVPVNLGLFDDAKGLVQVSGTGLSAGQHVAAPNA
jgi:hypothetical protein